MNMATRITVTAAEFTRQFGQLRQTLGDRPVFVTHHGRETYVLLTASRFASLREQQATGPAPGLPRGLAGWIREGLLVLDPAGAILSANDQAAALLGCTAPPAVGAMLWEVAPALRGTVMETVIRRALLARERVTADLPHPADAGRWVQLAVHPAPDGTSLLLRDITADVAQDRLADEAQAIDRACESHPDIARIRVNPRGHVVAADATACAWVGLEPERLRRVAVADLMPTAHKAAFREALDEVIGDGKHRNLASALLTNKGAPLPISVGLAQLAGVYGVEGAVMLATRGAPSTAG